LRLRPRALATTRRAFDAADRDRSAVGDDLGRTTFRDDWMGVRISAFQFG